MSNSKAASLKTMNELHLVLTQRILEDLGRAHHIDPETKREVIPTALYNVIRQFLKDNGITKEIGRDGKDPLSALARRFTALSLGGDDDDDGIPTI